MIRIRAMKISEQLIKPERKTSINPIYDFNGCMKLMIGALITPIVSTQKLAIRPSITLPCFFRSIYNIIN